MNLYNRAFLAMSFFLIGVALASTLRGASHLLIIAGCLTMLVVLAVGLYKGVALALLASTLFIGAGYTQWFALRHQQFFTAPIGQSVVLTGLIEKVASSGQSQRVDLALDGEYRGRLRLTLRQYPVVRYGDRIQVTGSLEALSGPAAEYFLKEGIGATLSFPTRLEILAREQGHWLKAKLFAMRAYVQESFERTLAPESATLMTGLVLGKSGGFSKEFTEKLKVTGTTHLVALSGYNIAVIINSLFLVFGLFLKRGYAVWFCILAVIGFVIMTGAEASVVRAAIMATMMVLAERTGRLYSVRNAIAATACVMVLINPFVLTFDVGFQLSFLALLGIVYVEPALRQRLRLGETGGWLGWQTHLSTTVAAQAAVLPILFSQFGSFPPLALFANILLLMVVPYIMTLGVVITLTTFFAAPLAGVVALPAALLLKYALGIIDIFAQFPLQISLDSLPLAVSVLYYAALAGWVYYEQQRQRLHA